ncbi:MAG: phosphoribosylformylglycinamidine cyclo-ligase [Christensenellales bacterium]|jgi:phosphoribosylformylglycinamidine cyclo-ligase
MSLTYKEAGVDVEAGYRSVQLMKGHVAATMNSQVLSGLANFGGMYALGAEAGDKVLVSGTDGVGTKLMLAFVLDKHDTVGIDCVAMCANDVVCHGAAPLFFLDYIATGKVVPEKIAEIVKGVAEGCLQANCALIGGETAEMPGLYGADEYDMAGFCVGMADRDKLIDGSAVREGDVLVGLASSGIHSNGFSLVRRLFKMSSSCLDRYVYELETSLGAELLKPTRIYVRTALQMIREFDVHGMAHITGGGFYENIPRILPCGLQANIVEGSWPSLPVFDLIQSEGNIERQAMFNTFNMGIGMVMALAPEQADAAVERANELGEKAYRIGQVEAGEAGVVFCP